MDQAIKDRVELWRENLDEPELVAELEDLCKNKDEDSITDAFYRDLAFGTAGLRLGFAGFGFVLLTACDLRLVVRNVQVIARIARRGVISRRATVQNDREQDDT